MASAAKLVKKLSSRTIEKEHRKPVAVCLQCLMAKVGTPQQLKNKIEENVGKEIHGYHFVDPYIVGGHLVGMRVKKGGWSRTLSGSFYTFRALAS